jgi:uncharacterized protein (DUF2249 family)
VTVTESDAFQAMLAHHRNLSAGVEQRVDSLRASVEAGGSYEPAVGDLVAYLAEEVIPHAVAEEHSIYLAARDRPGLGEVVAGMVDEHRHLVASVERLATAETGSDAAAVAEGIGSLFAAHVAKENELILPPLEADPTVDLSGLLVQMHRLTEAPQRDTTTADYTSPDTETRLVGLLLEAADGLAGSGHGDTACRLAAAAWAALRTPRPDLAGRVTAALHRLVRSVTSEPVSFTPGPRPAVHSGGAELDVRSLAPAQRHEQIFATYGALGPGTSFVLVNDHDPKPLRYQFEAEHTGDFFWQALEEGPTVWRVRIGRVQAPVGR